MAVAEKRLKLIMEWFEAHPEKYEAVKNKIKSLNMHYAKVQKAMAPVAKTSYEQAQMTNALNKVRAKETIQLMGKSKNLGRMSKAIGLYYLQQEKTRKSMRNWGRRLSRTGYRLGWFAFRLVIVGRMILKWMTKPITEAVKILKDWDKSLETVAMALGLLESQGMLTGEMSEFLYDAMDKLPEVGTKFSAALKELEAVLIGILVDLGDPLTSALHELALAFLDVWNEVSPTLIPALEDLIDDVLPDLIDLLKDVGPEILTAFVDGLEIGVPLLVDLLKAIEPLLPSLAKMAGILAPFAPAIMAFGLAMYFLNPAIIIAGPLLAELAIVFKALAVKIGLLSGASATLGGVQTSIAAFGTTSAVASTSIWGLVGAFAALALAVVGLKIGIDVLQDYMKAQGTAGELAATMGPTGRWAELRKNFWDLIGDLTTTTKETERLKETLGSLTEELNTISGNCFTHAASAAEMFTGALQQTHKDVDKTIHEIDGLTDRLRRVGAPEIGIGPAEMAEIRPMILEVNMPMTFENIQLSTGMDLSTFLDSVQDSVSKGLADGVKKVR